MRGGVSSLRLKKYQGVCVVLENTETRVRVYANLMETRNQLRVEWNFYDEFTIEETLRKRSRESTITSKW